MESSALSASAGTPVEVQVLTASGRAAIATLAVKGPAAEALIGAFFRPANGRPLADQPLRRIVFGSWGPPPDGEQIVVARLEDAVELHCHGGSQAVQRIIGELTSHPRIRASVKPARPLLPPRATALEYEAADALALADTERTALPARPTAGGLTAGGGGRGAGRAVRRFWLRPVKAWSRCLRPGPWAPTSRSLGVSCWQVRPTSAKAA